LNVLGRTPWRINNDVLNIVEKLWDEGGGVGEIPLKYYDYSDYVRIIIKM
jgi:DNA-directed RNA polymerase